LSLRAGGASGIGFAVAQAALTAGADVTIVGRSATKLHQAATKLAHEDQVHTFVADITSEAEW
jgi:3-hydroxybutyrate dehydrogenase